MPFTFSHPALVIPLLHYRQRWPWLSATGLVVGSIAPDFEKLFRLKLASGYSHTVVSLFYFSWPVGLALAFAYHGLVRQPLLGHLPKFLHRRLAGWQRGSWLAFARQHPLGVLASIWLGGRCIYSGTALRTRIHCLRSTCPGWSGSWFCRATTCILILFWRCSVR